MFYPPCYLFRYSTDALESCKIQIIGIENKLGGFIKKTKEPVTTVKVPNLRNFLS